MREQKAVGVAGQRQAFMVVSLALVALSLALCMAYFHGGRGKQAADEESIGADLPPDPRLDYSGPLGNVHPSVKYVGDAACAACHAELGQNYRRHPTGTSLAPVAMLAATQA